jgi:hypothetical protein
MTNSTNPLNPDSTDPLSPNERQPLLGTPSSDNGLSTESEDDDYATSDDSLEIDEDVLDSFVAKFGSSIGTLGLDGGAPTAPPIRRFSISQQPFIDSRRRQSQIIDPDDLPSGRRKSYARVTSRRKSSQWDHIEEVASVTGTETSEIEGSTGRKSKYLGGVSEARFWAVFGSILLVYFVR